VIILQGIVPSAFGQQTPDTLFQPKKITDSELPDHSITPDSTYKFFGQLVNDSIGYQLFSKNLKTGDTTKLSIGIGFFGKVIMSPNGKQIAYEWNAGNDVWGDGFYTEIKLVNIDGTGRQVLYSDSVLFSQLQDWSPDGKYLSAMVFNKKRLFQSLLIPASGSPVKVLRKQQFKALNLGFLQCKMSFSDNGEFIAYDISRNNSWYERDIYIRPISGGNEIPVVKNFADNLLIGWTPGSKGIVFSSDQSGKWDLYFLKILNGKPQGSPQMVVQDMGAPITVLDFTNDGSLYYKMGVHDTFHLSIATLDTSSKKIMDTKILSSHIGFNTAVQWSRDGKHLAYAWGIGSGYEPLTLAIRSDKTGKERLIVLDKLMRHGGHSFEPQWSPDGKYIISDGRLRDYYGPGMDSQGLYEIDLNSGTYKPIKTSSTICGLDCYWTPLWLKDGELLFGQRLTATLFLKDLKTGIENEIYHQADSAVIRTWPTSCLAVSPDGKQIAFISAQRVDEKWINKLMLLSISGGQPKELLTASGGQQLSVPAWMPDSHNIIFALSKDAENNSFELVTINIDSKKTKNLGLAMDGVVPYSLSVHPDGKRIAFTAGKEIYYREENWVLRNFLGTFVKKP
jgi:Tol biopolymer transport system component